MEKLIQIPDECIDCPFNYDTIDCKLREYIDGYGDTKDDGKPEHCNIVSFTVNIKGGA